MPQHGVLRVNNVEGGKAEDLVVSVEDVHTSLFVVKDRLLNGGVYPGCDQDCSECAGSEDGCVQLRAGIQNLIDEGCLQFARAVRDRGVVSTVTIYFKPSEGRGQRVVSAPTSSGTPVTISAPVTVSTPTTIVASGRRAVDSRVVPWKYDNAYRSNRRAESQARPVNQSPVTIGLPSRTPVVVGPVVDNVRGPGGYTRSGRLFAP
jgi:hypothetical protein